MTNSAERLELRQEARISHAAQRARMARYAAVEARRAAQPARVPRTPVDRLEPAVLRVMLGNVTPSVVLLDSGKPPHRPMHLAALPPIDDPAAFGKVMCEIDDEIVRLDAGIAQAVQLANRWDRTAVSQVAGAVAILIAACIVCWILLN